MQTSERILEALRAEPGISVAHVARVMGIDQSTASYHLRRLAQEGKVSAVEVGRERAWFASGCGLCPVLRRAVPAIRRAGVAPVAVALRDTPMPLGALAREAGLSPSEARWALGVLQEVGIARREATGKAALVEGAEECVARALAEEPCPLWGACAPSTGLRPSPSRS